MDFPTGEYFGGISMKTVNSISGGKTSSYIAANYPADYDVFALVRTDDKNCMFPDDKLRQMVSDKIGKEFIGTLEMDEIIHTIFDLEQFIGREITWLSGDTFEDMVKKYKMKKGGYFLPNKMTRYCTTDLKTRPIAAWRYNNIKDDVIMNFGYRANEMNRAKKMQEKLNKNGCTEVKIIVGTSDTGRNKWKTIEYCNPSFPLIRDNIYKDTIEKYWKDKPVRFAYMNNCVGCWWRNPLLLKKMSDKCSNKMQFFSDLEDLAGSTFRSDVKYAEIISWKSQMELFDDDFSDCDSGYCGL